MSDDATGQRRFPYIWPTWIAPLLAGDRDCWWAAWFKAHHSDYQKLEDPDESRLKLWKAEHAQFVRETAAELRAGGWTVRIEGQNKMRVKGRAAEVGAKPDLVAVADPGRGHVVDCKTGRRKDGDFWQVVTYIALATLKGERLHDRLVTGAVRYCDGEVTITAEEALDGAPRVFSAIATIGLELEPERVPSEDECRDCNIACCPDRAAAPVKTVETEAF
jgi:hypothetical protein